MNVFYYHPDKDETVPAEKAELHQITYDKDKKINALLFKRDKPIASIFILHGNGGSLNGWQSVAEMIYEEGYQTFIIDFPGYGDSDGKAKHSQVIESSQKAFEYFNQLPEVSGTKKIMMGFSLGANLALKTSADNQDQLDGLILEGAFTNYREIGIYTTPKFLRFAPWLVLGSKFKGEELIKSWTKPLLIVHSKEDYVCPYFMGEEIYKNAASSKKELWTIPGKHLEGFRLKSGEYFAKIQKMVSEMN